MGNNLLLDVNKYKEHQILILEFSDQFVPFMIFKDTLTILHLLINV